VIQAVEFIPHGPVHQAKFTNHLMIADTSKTNPASDRNLTLNLYLLAGASGPPLRIEA